MSNIVTFDDGTKALVLATVHEDDVWDVASQMDVALSRDEAVEVLKMLANEYGATGDTPTPDLVKRCISTLVHRRQPDTDNFTVMYHMQSGSRRAMLLASNGMDDKFMATCSENNVFKSWIESDVFMVVREHAEDFVMGR